MSGMYANGATGLAKLRRDGFVSMEGKGELLTRKLCFNNKTAMYLNASGRVKVEILSEDGKLTKAAHTFSGDSTKAQVVFDGFSVAELEDTVFRIKFTVDGALYSFGFADENGEFGGARAAGVVRD